MNFLIEIEMPVARLANSTYCHVPSSTYYVLWARDGIVAGGMARIIACTVDGDVGAIVALGAEDGTIYE